MNTHRLASFAFSALAATLALSGSALVTGCASAPPVAQKMADPVMGAVVTYHRKSSGSLGNFDGQVVWTYSPSTWQGRPMVAVGAPQAGITLHDPASFGVVAQLNAAGQPLLSFEPPINYRWPMAVGSSWSSEHQVSNHVNGRTTPMRLDYQVLSWGDVTVPAGTFKAYQVRWTSSLGETETRWINPVQGLNTIRRLVDRSASHPQGAGALEAQMLSRVLPAAR